MLSQLSGSLQGLRVQSPTVKGTLRHLRLTTWGSQSRLPTTDARK